MVLQKILIPLAYFFVNDFPVRGANPSVGEIAETFAPTEFSMQLVDGIGGIALSFAVAILILRTGWKLWSATIDLAAIGLKVFKLGGFIYVVFLGLCLAAGVTPSFTTALAMGRYALQPAMNFVASLF